jgi:hypothetical protein
VYVRNQRANASQDESASSNPVDVGWMAARTRSRVGMAEWGTPWLVYVAGREATVKGCGVAVAMPQGHSWAPPPPIGYW